MQLYIFSDSSAHIGGAATVAIRNATLARKAGLEVFFISGGVEAPAPELIASGVVTVSMGQPRLLDTSRSTGAINGLWNLSALRFLRDVVSHANSGAVFHVHSWSQTFGPVIFEALYSVRSRTLVTLHDYLIECPNGGFFDFKGVETCNRKGLSLDCLTTNCDKRSPAHKLWRYSRAVLQRGAIRDVRDWNFICVSQLQKSKFTSLNRSKVHIIRNPVSVNQNERVEVEKNQAIAFVGRLSDEKGIRVFLRAVAECNLESKALVIGDGPLGVELRNGSGKVEFTGWKSGLELDRLFKRMRVLVFPSLWDETYGLVTIEAVSKGIPVIASSSVGAINDLNRFSGAETYPNGNLTALKECLLAMEDSEKIKRKSVEAYTRYWEQPLADSDFWEATLKLYLGASGRVKHEG